MQSHFKEKKEAAGRFGGRFGNLKLTPKVSFFFFFKLFFFGKAVKCAKGSRGAFLPSQPPLRDFLGKS